MDILAKIRQLNSTDRNAVLVLIETLYQQELKRQRKMLKVWHK